MHTRVRIQRTRALRACAQVLGHGRFAVDYRDGVTSHEEIDGRQLRLPDASEVAA